MHRLFFVVWELPYSPVNLRLKYKIRVVRTDDGSFERALHFLEILVLRHLGPEFC